MKLVRQLSVILAAGLASASLAQPLNYANKTVKIRAGVLLIASQQVAPGLPLNPVPHHWSNLDKDTSVKPASWIIESPLGQTSLTGASRARWLANPQAGAVPPLSSRLSKNDAAYWEVSLNDVTDDTLSRFDVLSLTMTGFISLNSKERERLRRYVDQGGILWADLLDEGGLNYQTVNGLPYTFQSGFNTQPYEVNLGHPLFRSPNGMTIREVGSLSYPGATQTVVSLGSFGFGPVNNVLGDVERASLRYEVVAANSGGSVISVARIGDGYIVLTSRGITATLGRGIDPSIPGTWQANRGFRGLNPVSDQAFLSAAKFAVNVISLSSSYTHPGSGSRKSNSSRSSVLAPVLRRFSVAGPAAFTDRNAPVLFKGRMIVTAGALVGAFDAKPSSDLDGDGNPDDGTVDPVGAGFDILWQTNVGSSASAPVAVEVPDTTLASTNQVWVVGDNGQVRVFNLFTGALMTTINPPGNFQSDSDGPYAVTIQDGTVFVTDSGTDNLGRVWAIDLATATVRQSTGNPWLLRGSPRMLRPSASPTVGYIPIRDNSGGLDRVLYLATEPDSTSGRAAGMTSVWIGARGESPVEVTRTGTNVDLQLRASLQNLPVALTVSGDPGVRISLILPNGDPFSLAQMQAALTGAIAQPSNGVVRVTLGGAAPAFDYDGNQTPNNPNDDVAWRVDYSLDWGATGSGVPGDSYVRGNVEFPDTSALTRRVVGSPTLAGDGNIGIVTSHPAGVAPGSTFFNLKEDGRGDFLMRGRFDLHDEISTGFQVIGVGNLTYRESVVDEDDLNIILPFLNSRISNWRFVGAPAVSGDTMYVAAVGQKTVFGFPTEVSAIFAFKANPGPAEFEIATPGGTGATPDNNLTLVQPDMARSLNQANPTTFSALAPGQFTVEPIQDNDGNPLNDRSRVTLNSLMPMRRGSINSCLSLNLPVIVRRASQTDTVYEPEAVSNVGGYVTGFARGRWSPVRWYVVFNGYAATTSPVVTGDTLYIAGASLLPSLIASGNPFGRNGLMFGMDSQINANDPFLRSNSIRPWQSQLIFIRKTTNTPFTFNDAQVSTSIKWPQFRGIEDPDDFTIRLLQAAIEDPAAISLAAGDGSLAVTGASRAYAFSRSDFLVADEGRVSRFDPSGNPIWSTNQTLYAGRSQPDTSAGNIRNLSNPTRIYPAGDNGFWIVDTGNDAIMRIDSAGRELRTIRDIKIHPSLTPNGATENSALRLRQPRDVITYDSQRTIAQVATIFPGEVLRYAATNEVWEHAVIADAGNNRSIEVIDRYRVDSLGRIIGVVEYQDESGNFVPALGVMFWHSPEEFSGKKFAYNSVARTFIGVPARSVYAFGFGNVEPGKVTFGLDSTGQDTDASTGFGGVVVYDGSQTKVITEFNVPAINANTFLGEFPAGSGTYNFNLPVNNRAATVQKLVGLNSVSLRYVDDGAGPTLAVMVTTAGGVYELTETGPGVWSVRWMLPREAFVGMRRPRTAGPFTTLQLDDNPSSFRPTYARRLDSGEVLIVNGYYGTYIGGAAFNGEVLLVDGGFAAAGAAIGQPGYNPARPNLGFTALSVKFELPPIQGIRGLVRPVFADRQ